MNDRVTKNYFKDGGDTLVIGGKLVVEEGAEVEGLDAGGGSTPEYELPAATSETLGGVIVGDNLEVEEDGTLSVPVASASEGGVVKVGTGLAINDGVLSVSPASKQNNVSTDSATTGDLARAFNGLLSAMKTCGLMSST